MSELHPTHRTDRHCPIPHSTITDTQIHNLTRNDLHRIVETLFPKLTELLIPFLGNLREDADHAAVEPFLRMVVQLLDDLIALRAESLNPREIEESIRTILRGGGLVRVPVFEGEVFDPKLHRASDLEPTTRAELSGRIARVRGSCWQRERDGSQFTYAEVTVFRYNASA